MAVTAHSRSPAHPGAGVPWRRDAPRVRGTFSAPERAKSEKGPAEVGSYVDELLATQTSAGNSDISGYTLCANEWGSFALPGTCDVAYGANGAFAFRSAQSGTITFNNATFGDPISGVAKKGYYRLSGGQRFYAHANHLYSVAALTNQTGGVVERYRYDTYGQRTVLAADGVTTRAASAYNQQVGFTGRTLDKETGLWYYRTRMYSAQLGRFISRDEQEYQDGFDLYASFFVPNDTDPFGEQGWHKQALGGPVGNTDLLDSGITCECQDCTCPPNKKGTQKVVCKAAPQFDIQIDVEKLNKMNLKGWTVNTAYNHEKQHVDSVTAEIQKIVKERNDDETSGISASSCKTRASNAEKSLKGKVPAIKDKESKHSNPGSPKDGVPGAETPAAPDPTPPPGSKPKPKKLP